MIRNNLYKITFQNEYGVFVSVVVSVKKELKDSQVLLMIAKEVASNYCEDNHYTYDNKIINSLMDGASIQLLGTFEPIDETLSDLDFDIVSFNKTKHWRVK